MSSFLFFVLAVSGGALYGNVVNPRTVHDATNNMLHAATAATTSYQAGAPADAAQMLNDTTPLGEVMDSPGSQLEQDAELGVLYGNHPLMSAHDKGRVKDLAHRLKSCFALSMADCTGYTGDQGDFVIELDTDAPIFTPP